MARCVAEPAGRLMRCWVPRFAVFSLFTMALVWGCAQGGSPDVTPSIDPSLPEIDAPWRPSPEMPSDRFPDGAARDTSSILPELPDGPRVTIPETGAPDAESDEGSVTFVPSDPKPKQGEVLITEVMYNPSTNEPTSEWFEVYNVSPDPRMLSGLTIADGEDRTHVIGSGVVVAPGAYVVFARNRAAAMAAKVPSAAIAYEYGAGLPDNAGVQLANASSGGVRLRDGTATVAQAAYGGWYSQSDGRSIQFKASTSMETAQKTNWCLSLNPWMPGSDKGTPGAPADCP